MDVTRLCWRADARNKRNFAVIFMAVLRRADRLSGFRSAGIATAETMAKMVSTTMSSSSENPA